MKKKIVYVDLDDTLCKYTEHYNFKLSVNPNIKYPQSQYGFFTELDPVDIDIKFYLNLLESHYTVYIATRPSYLNPMSYTEKRYWVERNLGLDWCQKLIFIPDKALLIGDFLIDDKVWADFKGEQLLFGSEQFPTWTSCCIHLIKCCSE